MHLYSNLVLRAIFTADNPSKLLSTCMSTCIPPPWLPLPKPHLWLSVHHHLSFVWRSHILDSGTKYLQPCQRSSTLLLVVAPLGCESWPHHGSQASHCYPLLISNIPLLPMSLSTTPHPLSPPPQSKANPCTSPSRGDIWCRVLSLMWAYPRSSQWLTLSIQRRYLV